MHTYPHATVDPCTNPPTRTRTHTQQVSFKTANRNTSHLLQLSSSSSFKIKPPTRAAQGQVEEGEQDEEEKEDNPGAQGIQKRQDVRLLGRDAREEELSHLAGGGKVRKWWL